MLKITGLFIGALFLFLSSATSASADWGWESGGLYINEFASNTAGTTQDPDWVEIYNNASYSFDLSLYRLRDAAGNSKDLNGTINSSGSAVFDWSNRLNNTGDTIRLVAIANESVPLDQVGYGDMGNDVVAPASGQSAGRSVDGAGQWAIFSSPTKNSANIVSQTFVLAWGNNLVGLTVNKGTSYFAEDFAKDLGDKVLSITRWDSSRGRYFTHIPGSTTDNNFAIVLGEGYLVKTNGLATRSITGFISTISSIAIPSGYSMVSFPRILTGITNAEQLLQAMQTQGVDVGSINRWFGGRWIPHILDSEANNFLITPGEGYMIRNFGIPGTFTLP